MQYIYDLLLKASGASLAIKFIIIAIQVILVAMLMVSFTALISALILAYNTISDIMQLIQSTGTTSYTFHGFDVMAQFNALLTCMGVIDAINASKPVFFSSITFVLLRVLYIGFNMLGQAISNALTQVLPK